MGAGTSLPVFPSWAALVERLLKRRHSAREARSIARRMLREFPPDAVIQAARDVLGLRDDDFAAALAEDLYASARQSMSPEDFDAFNDILSLHVIGVAKKKQWSRFIRLMNANFQTTSAYVLAQILLEASPERRPRSVLSFNAEPMLLAMTHAMQYERFLNSGIGSPVEGQLQQLFDKVTSSLSSTTPGRVPYVFCHGLLPLPKPRLNAHFNSSSVHNLVFSEGDYLQLATTGFSWQASAFLRAAAFHPVVFVGVSLTDSNMRRWLAAAHRNRKSELESHKVPADKSTSHFWVRARPRSRVDEEWLAGAVAHLGVRIIWLDDWGEVGTAFRHMMNLPTPAAIP